MMLTPRGGALRWLHRLLCIDVEHWAAAAARRKSGGLAVIYVSMGPCIGAVEPLAFLDPLGTGPPGNTAGNSTYAMRGQVYS
jgi:hypothetical protein